MPDLYENLGNMLNQVLETGEIKKEEAEVLNDSNQSQTSASFISDDKKNETERIINFKRKIFKKKIPVGSVIKAESYFNYPNEIITAANLLELKIPYTNKSLKKQYHLKLKTVHPDLSNQNTISIDQITNAYNVLLSFLNTTNLK